MNCHEFHKGYIVLLDPDSAEPSTRPAGKSAAHAELAEHLKTCRSCGQFYDEITRTVALLRPSTQVSASPRFKEKVMDALARQGQRKQEGRPMLRSLSRLFSQPLRLTAASLAFLTLVGGVLFLLLSGHGRYALAQTVEAQRAVRTVHVTIEHGGMLIFAKDGTPEYPSESGATEMWTELDDSGKLVHFRMDMPFTLDGPKIVLWHDGKADIWFPSKNAFVTVGEPEGANLFPKQFKDPSAMVTELQQRAAEGKVKIVEARPTAEYKRFGKTEWMPKVLVVNPPEPQGQVEVFLIDPKTKLLQQTEKYRKNGSELVLLERIRFDDYNLPMAADIFAPQLPRDVMKIDQTGKKEIGLAQGQMTDAEVAKAVVQRFWEAMKAQDYDKASVLMGGFPAARLKESFSVPIVEIISIGEAKPDPAMKWYDGLFVPYVVKFKDGTG